ncbi:hypothetical protein GDO81_002424 [Engystomops pustulosus]|uniref:Uncharacterized protein n=1 Tax=Engystomops pustulosus TaxID=76066 RepID=A0AAV7DLU3_ENGPU|nr:hypothetical protein GDO81_002424 [Engystomops pustulosus]
MPRHMNGLCAQARTLRFNLLPALEERDEKYNHFFHFFFFFLPMFKLLYYQIHSVNKHFFSFYILVYISNILQRFSKSFPLAQ